MFAEIQILFVMFMSVCEHVNVNIRSSRSRILKQSGETCAPLAMSFEFLVTSAVSLLLSGFSQNGDWTAPFS